MRFAIHGFGRIGRCVLRAWAESPTKNLIPAAINEPADAQSMLYLSLYDSTHGVFPCPLSLEDEDFLLFKHNIALSHFSKIEDLKWRAKADLILECSGQYGKRKHLEMLLKKGGKVLILSNPGDSQDDVDQTIIFGFNEKTLTGKEKIISAASCTTLASVPTLSLIHQSIGIEEVFITTLHSVMNDQPLLDGYHHKDLRRTRSALHSLIPVSTGLAQGIERFLPDLKQHVSARAIRTPILNVSALDITLVLKKSVSLVSAQSIIQNAIDSGALPFHSYTRQAHASIDFNHNPNSAIVDFLEMRQSGKCLQLLIWFDNEWAYSKRLLDLADFVAEFHGKP